MFLDLDRGNLINITTNLTIVLSANNGQFEHFTNVCLLIKQLEVAIIDAYNNGNLRLLMGFLIIHFSYVLLGTEQTATNNRSKYDVNFRNTFFAPNPLPVRCLFVCLPYSWFSFSFAKGLIALFLHQLWETCFVAVTSNEPNLFL